MREEKCKTKSCVIPWKNIAERLSEALKKNDCTQVEKLIIRNADVNKADAGGTRPLQNAAQTGCVRCLTLLLNNGADIRATFTMNAPSAVSIAAKNGYVDALECLLNHCADKSIVDGKKEKQSPLHYACYYGKIDAVRCIVENYPHAVYFKVSADAKHCTSLHVAAEKGNVECMEVLIKHGAEIEAADTYGATALTYAARHGKLAAVRFLYNHGANAFAANRRGWLPLHSACFNGHVDVARFLLEKCPNTVKATSSENDGRRTPLHVVAQSGSVECLRVLLEHGGDINEQAVKSGTPLHIAASYGRAAVTTFLLNTGAAIMRDPNGCLPLHKAAIKGSAQCIELLLPYTDDINATTSLGRTAVHAAIMFGHRQALEVLFEHGASVTVGDIDGWLPVHLAALCSRAKEEDRVETLCCLLDKYPHLVDAPMISPNEDRRTTLHIAVANGQILIVDCLLKHGANIEAPNADGRTALHYAADSNEEQALTFLLGKGANAMAADCSGWLPIHFACQKGIASLVKALTTRCPRCVNALTRKSDGNKTPLHLAAKNGSVECTEALLACIAEVNAQTTNKHTPLHFAAVRGNTRAVELLLKRGADATIADEDGWLPLHFACSKDNIDCTQLLMAHSPKCLYCQTSPGTNNMTPLLVAASHGSANCVELLLAHLYYDQRAADGRSALHYGAQSGSKRTLELLKLWGFAIYSPDVNGWLPLHCASASGHAGCVRTLCEWYPGEMDSKSVANDGERTALHLAADNNHCRAVAALLECGADANKQMSDGRTALHLAAASDCVNCIKRLLSASVDITMKNNAGETALHVAAKVNSCNALFLLRQCQGSGGRVNGKTRQSAYVNSRTRNGKMPLHYSAHVGCEQCLRSLLEASASIEARDNEGRTALHTATIGERVMSAKESYEETRAANDIVQTSSQATMNEQTDGNVEAVRVLLAAGANTEVVDKEQKTPLQLAIETNRPNIVDVLLLHNASVETIDVHDASTTIKAMLKRAQYQREHIDNTVARIVNIDAERKKQVLNKERITQKHFLGNGTYGAVYAGIWHLPDVESEKLVPSVHFHSVLPL